VGTNDAMRHVAIDGFKNCLKKTLVWLKEQNIDIILINPQYSDTLVQDPFYKDVVAAIDAVAREQQVIVVDRFEAMHSLQRQRGAHFDLSSDDLHMNDEGYRHLAEHVAATIIKSLAPVGPVTAAAPQYPKRAPRPGALRKTRKLFDHLVCAREQCWRDGKSQRLCRFEVDDQLKFRRLLNRKLFRPGTLEDTIYIVCKAPVRPDEARPIG